MLYSCPGVYHGEPTFLQFYGLDRLEGDPNVLYPWQAAPFRSCSLSSAPKETFLFVARTNSSEKNLPELKVDG